MVLMKILERITGLGILCARFLNDQVKKTNGDKTILIQILTVQGFL